MKEQKKIHHILQSGDEAKEIKHFIMQYVILKINVHTLLGHWANYIYADSNI